MRERVSDRYTMKKIIENYGFKHKFQVKTWMNGVFNM